MALLSQATVEAVITLDVTDDGFDGLATLVGAALVLGLRLALSAVNNLDAGVV